MEPIYFPEGEHEKARAVFEEVRNDVNIPGAWLVSSDHWATKGHWIEFVEPGLSVFDSVIDCK